MLFLHVQEESGISILQQEKNIRTQVEALVQEKSQRMQQLQALLDQDQDLCDVLCSVPYGIVPDSVPSLEQLENFRQHISKQNVEKVRAFLVFRHVFLCCSVFWSLKVFRSQTTS